MHTLAERTYVNKDSTKVVAENSPDAAYLLGNAGDEISLETASRLGLDQPATADEDPYAKMKKPELVALAEERGLDASGKVDELRALLADDDDKAEAAEVGAGGDGTEGGTADVGSPEGTADEASPA